MIETVIEYILTALAVLIALTLHEFSHAYAAYRLGDNTAKYAGRLTLNPIKHLDPIGTLCLVFFHFGWARPVPIDARNFKKPKRDFAISALMGPLANIVTAFVFVALYLLSFKWYVGVYTSAVPNAFLLNLTYNLTNFLAIFVSVNIGLGVFNLIPCPPLDGSRLLGAILPERVYFRIMKYERYIYLVLLGWLVVGDYLSNLLLSISFISASPPLTFLAKILSLSDMIGQLIGWLIDLAISFWQLFPFFKF